MDAFKEKMMRFKADKKLDNQKKATKLNIYKNKKKTQKIEITILLNRENSFDLLI